ncbi:MAG: RNA-guided endonuclease InsQ/TnpB family protein [Methanobrevibacter sp.]
MAKQQDSLFNPMVQSYIVKPNKENLYQYSKYVTNHAKLLYNQALYIQRQCYSIFQKDELTDDEFKFLKTIDGYVKEYDESLKKNLPTQNLKRQKKALEESAEFTPKVFKETQFNKKSTYLSYGFMDFYFKTLSDMESAPNHYKRIPAAIAQQVLKKLDSDYKSYFALIKKYKTNPKSLNGLPHPPHYVKNTKYKSVDIASNGFSLNENGIIKFAQMRGNKSERAYVRTNIPSSSKFLSARIIPLGNCFKIESVYDLRKQNPVPSEIHNIIGIDLGINGFLTIFNNVGLAPIIINGKNIKSLNQWYNKRLAFLKSELDKCNKNKPKEEKQYTTKNLRDLSAWRKLKFDDIMHKISKWVVEYCKENDIDTIIVGKNDGWKQNSNIGKVNNQKFVSIPYESFLNKLEYKTKQYGINFIKTEESYTSKASFFDNDLIPTYKKDDKQNYKFSGKRDGKKYVLSDGRIVHADVNGAANIIKKVVPNAFEANGIDGIWVSPKRINIF